jgi:competence ComEA-like helix-hairpin-helix protein
MSDSLFRTLSMQHWQLSKCIPWLQRGLIGLIGFLCLALVLRWCQGSTLGENRLQPLPQDSNLQVYMNHNPVRSYTEPYRKTQRSGDNLEQLIIDQIQSARTSIDVAVQELRSPLIAQALRDRYRAGVRVRLVLENSYNRPLSTLQTLDVEQLEDREQDRYRENFRLMDRDGDGQLSAEEKQNNDALKVLQSAGIPHLDDKADGSEGSGLMHHKFVVIDGQRVLVTSANFTMSDLHGDFQHQGSLGNANSLVLLESRDVATLFTQEFNFLWGDGPEGKQDSLFGVKKPFRPPQSVQIGRTRVWVKFSPTPADIPWSLSSNGLIAQTLGQSRKSMDMALFVFSDQQIANALEEIARRKVQIRVLIEPTFAYQSYSEGLDLLGAALPRKLSQKSEGSTAPSCITEADNRPWATPVTSVGVPKLPRGDLLHHKFGLSDRRTVVMGSHNWSEAADRLNDETILVIENETVAAHYDREFERLFAQSRLGLPAYIRQEWQAALANCGGNFQVAASLGTKSGMPTQAPTPQATSTTSERVNLNTATLEELEQLPGVGRALAQRIIDTRQKKPFRSLEDFDRVPGVGKKVLRQVRDRITW